LRLGVIDIGTDATRLLVADVEGGALRPVLRRRHRLRPIRGRETALAELLAAETRRASAAGARELEVVASPGLRRQAELRRLERACRGAGARSPRILSTGEQARLAFIGATRGTGPETGPVAVAEVGRTSTEIAVGIPGAVPSWWASRPVGAATLTERALLDDPPTAAQVEAARGAVERRLGNLVPPPSKLTLLAGIPPSRSRLLPGTRVILDALAEMLPGPMRVAPGGRHEGFLLSRAASGREAAA
jgi:exopolyphosphatase/guanosine-5'-triphosphate,3'-diphosphate pyrophosphatase